MVILYLDVRATIGDRANRDSFDSNCTIYNEDSHHQHPDESDGF